VAGSLKAQLRDDITSAMKSGERVRLGALRMLSAAITNREKDVLHDLSDDEIRDVAGKEVKKRSESIEAFEAAGRDELAQKERDERTAIEGYAPEQLSDEEVDAAIAEAIAASGATSAQDLGKVMGAVMGKLKGRVDGNVVRSKVQSRLTGAG
jgi:uncharacterized protein